jgi:lipid II:glycine glycyltransferase (peptidoglycan interpeptide bridge formation enzyme)
VKAVIDQTNSEKGKTGASMDVISGDKILTHGDRTFKVSWSDEPNDPEWDDFVVSIADGHHEQTSLWGQVRAFYGWKIARYIIREQDRIIAGAQAQLRPIGRIGHVAYITYGPCIITEEELVTQICITELKRFLRSLGVIYTAVGLPYQAYGLVKLMETSGFTHKPHQLHPHFLETTLVIDLTKPPEEILEGMRASTRRNIRHAQKNGMTVIEGGAQDIGTFRQLMCDLCARRNITPNPPQADFFQSLWRIFSTKGWIKLFIAMHDNEPVSAAIAFSFRDWFRVWKVGWSGEYGGLKPNEAMWWEMIQYARRMGYRHFDFVEIDPNQVNIGHTGKNTHPPFENVTSFKLGFGGEIKVLPGTYCFFSNPLLRMVMHWGGDILLDSKIVQQLVQIYTKRSHRSSE